MQDFKFSVIFKDGQEQSGDITADSDLFYEVVSILTEQIVYHNVEKNEI
ncbi:MAG: hypothetical protein IKV76_07105 [Clostridia bacterium]|nr:hypothetical protein [Clostridia bacterium]